MFGQGIIVRFSSLVCVGAVLSSCSGPKAPQSAEAPPAAVAGPAHGHATVSGRVAAPKPGTSTVVMLKPNAAMEFPAQTAQPVMDQIALAFTPTILFTRIGQPAEFRNSDDELHNIRVMDAETKEPAFNVALPTGGTFRHTFDAEGFYDVGCDIHPGMSAVVIASQSPFSSVVSDGGQFTFSNVPAGDYTLSVYTGADRFERTVSVTPGQTDLGTVAP
jgi:plastocyanin